MRIPAPRKPAPGEHNWKILACPWPQHPGYHYFHCARCGVISPCYMDRSTARIAGDQYHSGGKLVAGFSHSAAERV